MKSIVIVLLLATSALGGLQPLGLDYSLDNSDVIECKPGHPAMFKFLGRNIVKVGNKTPQATFENHCFKENSVNFSWLGDNEIKLVFDSHNKRNLICGDTFIVTTIMSFKVHLKFFAGKSTVSLKLNSIEEADYVKANGVSVIPACDRLVNILPDILDTVAMFDSEIFKHLPQKYVDEMKLKNFEKLEKLSGQKFIDRKFKQKVSFDWLQANAKSGDVYCTYDDRGGSTITLFGTGGVCAHTGMFLWRDNELWAVESNTPVIKKKKAVDYLAGQHDIGSVNLLVLKDEYRAKFDAEKAWAEFDKHEGEPYGFENFLFSFWDTPEDNFTDLANTDIMMTLVAILNQFPEGKNGIDRLLGEAFNKRLGTDGLSFEQILDEASKRGLSIGDLGAIPEKAGEIYGKTSGVYAEKFICSAFTTHLLMVGGALGGLNIVPQEFTPNDVYNMAIWEENSIPELCAEHDPYLPYCQLVGYRALVPFKYYNKIVPYDHMNEK